MIFAAASCHLNVVKWLYKNNIPHCINCSMNAAVQNGNLEIIKFLINYNTVKCFSYQISVAKHRNYLNIVNLLRNKSIHTPNEYCYCLYICCDTGPPSSVNLSKLFKNY